MDSDTKKRKVEDTEEESNKKGKVEEEVVSTKLSDRITEESWRDVLSSELEESYFDEIEEFLKNSKAAGKVIFPPEDEIFTALNKTPFDKVKVVIIGQDPYHGYDQAMGMSFSVKKGVTVPPSLKNIFKELESDITGFKAPQHGDLTNWATQGVLLLNATLTVEHKKPNSHEKIGWQNFTDAVIKAVDKKLNNVVFILWGSFAQKKASFVNQKKHLVLKCAHPSPYSCDRFFGCKHFSKTNDYLEKVGKEKIEWCLKE